MFMAILMSFSAVGQTYTVTVTSGDPAKGTVTGGGTYTSGTSVTIVATPQPGYMFSAWTENGRTRSGNAEYTFTVTRDRNFVAEFTEAMAQYTVTTVTLPNNDAGTVTGGRTVYEGDVVTLTATETNPLYTFGAWFNDAECTDLFATGYSTSFAVTADKTVYAKFNRILQQHTVNVAASPAAGGTVTGGGSYYEADPLTLTATPNTGYDFLNWTLNGEVVSTDATYSFNLPVMDSDPTYVANFVDRTQIYTVTLTRNNSSYGTVNFTSQSYYGGTEATVVATPANQNYHFVGWVEGTDTVSREASYTFVVNSDRTLQAFFRYVPPTYTINASASPSAGGTVTGAGSYSEGSTATLQAAANNGFNFVNWTEGVQQVSTNANYSFTVTGNRTLVANFVQTYAITAVAGVGGSVSGSGTYNNGATATVVATPDNDYVFSNWTENGQVVSNNASYSFTVNGARTLTANFLPKYSVSLIADPAAGGTVSGAGSFAQGSNVTVTATANAGYTFVNWTEGGVGVSSNSTYTIENIQAAHTLVANFVRTTYTISTVITPVGAGSVTGAGTVQHGASVSLTATPATGYTFAAWKENGTQISTNNPLNFTATANRTIEAVFNTVVSTYSVNASCSPLAGGTITRSADGPYASGASLTLTATPNTYYVFQNWTENGQVVSSNAAYTFEVTSNRTLVANFRYVPPVINITATVSPANSGCTVEYPATATMGDQVTLTAHNATNYTFTRWTENGALVSTANPYSFTADDQDHNFVAVFTYQAPTVTISTQSSPVEGGTVTGGGNYTVGTNVTLSANAATNYNFSKWTVNNQEVSTANPYVFAASDSRTVVAVFTRVAPTYTITASTSPAAGGRVEGLGNGRFEEGSIATLTAVANNDYTFNNWTEGNTVVSTSATFSFEVNGNRNLVANFNYTPQTYSISATCDPANSGTVAGTGSYVAGATARLTATANSGYEFVDWTENGVSVSTANPYNFTVNAARNLVAHFNRLSGTYTISAMVTPDGAGVVTGAGEYAENANVQLVASANPGYTFVGWYEGNTLRSSSTTYAFNATADRILYAVFEYQATQYAISANVYPDGVGSVTGAGTYDEGTYVTLRAVSTNNSYTFLNWTENGRIVSPNSVYSFIALADRNLVANFYSEAGAQYTITATANDPNAGTVNGGGVYVDGEAVTLTATPAPNYYFANWTENGQIISTSETYTFIASANRNIVGNFECFCHTQVTLDAGEGTIGDGSGSENYLPNTNCRWLIRPAGAETVTLTFTSFNLVQGLDYVDIYDGSNPSTASRLGHFTGHSIPAAVTSTTGVMLVLFTTNGTRTDQGWEANYTSTYGEDSYLRYSDGTKTIVVGCRPTVTSVHIPGRVRKIASRAFEGCNDMVRISLPSSIDTIEDHAFYNCAKLEKVNLPASVRYLGSYAFAGCSKLEQATLPSALDTIRPYTFYNCSALKRIEIPTTVKWIGDHAFYGCSSVYSLIVPGSVDTVCSYAFAYMNGLSFVTLNAGNKHFANNAFYNYSWRNTILLTNFKGSVADWTSISWGNEYSQPMRQSRNFAINGEIINDLVIPEGVDSINGFAFYNNAQINTITLPTTLDSIGNRAFYNLSGLERIYLNGPEAKVHEHAFDGVSNKIPVVVPCDVLDSIRIAGWSIFTRFVGEGVPILTVMQRKGGLVKIIDEPTCDDFTATVEAVPGSSYNFVSWSDGSTENPHTITLTDDDVIAAVFQRKVTDPYHNGYISFETEQDLANWYSESEGNNLWYIGNAVYNGGNNALYVSNDGGANNVSQYGNNPYIYTDFYLLEGVYDFSFHWHANGYDANDNLRVALIPDDVDMSPDADGAIKLGSKLYGESNWENFERTAQIAQEGWYKLVFFWNHNDGSNIDPAAAIDDIHIEYKESWRLDNMWWNVVVMSSDDNAGSVSGGGFYNYNETFTIEAYPNEHYRFLEWNDGNTDNPRQIAMSEYYGNREPFIAYFVEAPWQVIVDIDHTEAGNVIGSGYFETGERDTIAMVYPQAGWAFLGWIDNLTAANDTIYDNPYYITVNSDVHLTAVMTNLDTIYIHDTIRIPLTNPFDVDDNVEPEIQVLSEASEAIVYLENGQIVVEGAGKYIVSLYDVNGRLLASKQDEYSALRFDVLTSGTYMLRIGNHHTRKLVVIK